MSVAGPQPTPKLNTGSRRRLFAMVVVSLGVGTIFMFLMVISFGAVDGTELNPKTTAERTFFYFQIPWVHIPISPVFRGRPSLSAGRHLVANGHWKKSATDRWDLVLVESPSGPRFAEAAVLWQFLRARDQQGKYYWVEWTKRHPELAKRHWPIVEQLAASNLYPYVTVAFEAAQQATDISRYDEYLRTHMKPLLRRDEKLAAANGDDDRLAVLRSAIQNLGDDGDPHRGGTESSSPAAGSTP